MIPKGSVVDVHAHVFPQAALATSGTGSPWFDAIIEREADYAPVLTTAGRRMPIGSLDQFESHERRLEDMDRTGVDIQFLSLLPPLFQYHLPAGPGLEMARQSNDEIAEMCARWPNRFRGLATLPLGDPDGAIREIERTTGELGFVGAQIGTYVVDRNLDDPALFPVFEALARNRAFVFVHPSMPRGGPALRSYHLGNLIGNTYETTIAVASVVFGGILERLPELVICFAHGGGYGVFARGRFDHGYRVRPEPRLSTTILPSEQISRIYVDSIVHDPVALRYIVDAVGIDHVVVGSDYPADMGPIEPAGFVRDATTITDLERTAILSGNVERMLGQLGRLA